MDDKLLNKEKSKKNSKYHVTYVIHPTYYKIHVLYAKDNIREKKKRPDVDSIFNHIATSSATNIDRDVVESVLGELINQKIISNKKTSSGCVSF